MFGAASRNRGKFMRLELEIGDVEVASLTSGETFTARNMGNEDQPFSRGPTLDCVVEGRLVFEFGDDTILVMIFDSDVIGMVKVDRGKREKVCEESKVTRFRWVFFSLFWSVFHGKKEKEKKKENWSLHRYTNKVWEQLCLTHLIHHSIIRYLYGDQLAGYSSITLYRTTSERWETKLVIALCS